MSDRSFGTKSNPRDSSAPWPADLSCSCTRLGPSQVDLSVPIRVDNARTPALGSFGIMGLVPGIDVDPRDPATDPEIYKVILADLVMIRAKARVDMLPVTRLRIVQGQLPVTLL